MTRTLKIAAVTAGSALALLFASFAGTAAAKDRNHDRIPDRWEKRHKLSLKVNQANRDQDRDKVDNFNEFDEGTNPRDPDTDNDGIKDGREDGDHDGLNNRGEDQTANQPDDQDTDDDGIEDGEENAGTIASFDGTTLVIDLAGGGQATGTVDSSTEVKCESEDEHESGDDSGDHASTSDSQSGDQSSDDDQGDDDQGDDENACSPADLTPGTAVHEAELDGTVFHEIELVK